MVDTLTEIKEKTNKVILEPGKYKVVIYNDDKTPMEFVIALLMKIFHHSEVDAFDLTMKVHNDGKGLAGIYTYEVAEQKGMEATKLAQANEYPLVIKVEAE